MYETFDHTADLGLRVRAADLNILFAEAGLGLASMLVEDVSTIRPERTVAVTLPADDREYLLFDWLKALLYHFDTERFLPGECVVRLDETGLHGVVRGEVMDPARHEPAHEVKAITYHGLRVEATADGWLAEVIVDI